MIKIITAMNNSELYFKLKEEKDFKLIGKNIQYKEGILELITKEKKEIINLLIIDENLEGEINFKKFLNLIKNNFEIIIIKINKKNNKKNITEKKENIYYTNIINIKKIKEIIKINKKKYLLNNKIITISGSEKTGKTTISIQIALLLNKLNKKILIINFNEKNNNNILFKIKKNKKNKKTIKNKIKNNKNKKLKNNKNNNIFLKNNKNNNIFLKNKIKKINNYLFYINLNKEIINLNRIKKIINNNINDISLNYDYIIIEIKNKKINNKINRKILKKSKNNFIISEANLLDIKNNKKIINKYLNIYKIEKKYMFLIINKKNKYSIQKDILKKCLENIELITEINYSDIYTYLINKKINNWDFVYKKIEKEYIPIIKKIENKNNY